MRLLVLLVAAVSLAFAGKAPDRDRLIGKLQVDLDRALAHGTPTDTEILLIKKSRDDLRSSSREAVAAAIENIDKVAHTQSFKPQDASDVRKDIANIRGHKSFLFLRLP